jgi:adenosylmethionine-8-amino-7-oxononanoate aminotransferase
MDDNILGRVKPAGAHLRQSLRDTLGQHPHVGDIRGVGLFCGVELVADRGTKDPLPEEQKTHAKVKSAAFAEGLICYPMGGTIDGKRGDHILLAPPFIATDKQLDKAVEILQGAIENALL